MSSKKINKKKEAIRRIEKRADRNEDSKEAELKTQEICRARAMPLSVASNKVLREEAQSKKPNAGLSDFFRNKHENDPKLASLPKDAASAKAYACKELRPPPHPPTSYKQ